MLGLPSKLIELGDLKSTFVLSAFCQAGIKVKVNQTLFSAFERFLTFFFLETGAQLKGL